MKILILVLCLFPITGQAFFRKVFEGYKRSRRVEILKLDQSLTETNFNIQNNKFDWALDLSTAHNDSFLQSLYSFNSQKTISQTNSIGVTKSSYRFGTLTFKHSQSNYDLSNWSATSLASLEDESLYEAKNEIGYSYELLNNNLQQDWRAIFAEKEASSAENEVALHEDYRTFFLAYIAAKQFIILDRHYKDYEKRAKRRVQKIEKRVKDGLSRSVDLKQAKFSLLAQRERVIQNRTQLEENVAVISRTLGITIKRAHYRSLKWTFKKSEKFAAFFEEIKNLNYEKLKTALKLIELRVEKQLSLNKQSLNLNLSYAKNAIGTESGESFSRSTFGNGRNEEKIISLNYSIPIGGQKSQGIKQRLNVLRTQNELKLASLSDDIKGSVEDLKRRIKANERIVYVARSKMNLAKSVVQDSQKLYLKGRVSFEEVLRAEENRINARISYTNFLYLLEESYINLAFASGQTMLFLERYVD